MNTSSRFSTQGNGNGNGPTNGNGNGNGAAVLDTPPNGNKKTKPAPTTAPTETPTPQTTDPTADTSQLNGQRDSSGRFIKGNRGGPGNPYNRHVANLKVWLAEIMDKAAIQRIGRKMLALAEGGNVQASRLLMQYSMPKEVKPDQMDLDEWKLFKEDGEIFALMTAEVGKPSSIIALEMLRTTRPGISDSFIDMTANMLTTPDNRLAEVRERMDRDPAWGMEYLQKGQSILPEKPRGKTSKGTGKRVNR